MLKFLEKFKKIDMNQLLRYLAAAVLICVPLYPKFPFISVPGTYVSIRLEDFVIFLAILAWAALNLKNIFRILKDEIAISFTLFILAGLASVLSAIFITQSIVPHIGFLHLFRRVEYISAFFIGLSVLKGKKDLMFFVKCLCLVILFSFIYGFGQKYWEWPVITTQNYEYSKGVALRFMPGGHLVSTFAGHYDLASFLILVLPFFFAFLVIKNEELLEFNFLSFLNKKYAAKVLFLVVISMGFWMLLQTASRISLVSYMGSVFLTLFLLRKYKAIALFLVVSIVFASFSTNLVSRYGRIFDVYLKRIISSASFVNEVSAQEVLQAKRLQSTTPTPEPISIFEDRSTSIRLNVEWPRALRAFRKNPLLGTGFSSITLATDNDYLRLLGEVGILGAIGFILIFISIFRNLLNAFPIKRDFGLESAFLAGIIGSSFGIFLNALFIDVFEASKFAILFWLFIGFAVSLSRMKIYEKSN